MDDEERVEKGQKLLQRIVVLSQNLMESLEKLNPMYSGAGFRVDRVDSREATECEDSIVAYQSDLIHSLISYLKIFKPGDKDDRKLYKFDGLSPAQVSFRVPNRCCNASVVNRRISIAYIIKNLNDQTSPYADGAFVHREEWLQLFTQVLALLKSDFATLPSGSSPPPSSSSSSLRIGSKRSSSQEKTPTPAPAKRRKATLGESLSHITLPTPQKGINPPRQSRRQDPPPCYLPDDVPPEEFFDPPPMGNDWSPLGSIDREDDIWDCEFQNRPLHYEEQLQVDRELFHRADLSHGQHSIPIQDVSQEKPTKCHSCGSTIPGIPLSARWFFGYNYCDACGKLFVKGNYCPVCFKVYGDNKSTPMVYCDLCDRWVHYRCDGISDEQYRQYQERKNLNYTCAACRRERYKDQDNDDDRRRRRRDNVHHDKISDEEKDQHLQKQQQVDRSTLMKHLSGFKGAVSDGRESLSKALNCISSSSSSLDKAETYANLLESEMERLFSDKPE